MLKEGLEGLVGLGNISGWWISWRRWSMIIDHDAFDDFQWGLLQLNVRLLWNMNGIWRRSKEIDGNGVYIDDLVLPFSFGCQVALGVAGGEVLLAENQTMKMRLLRWLCWGCQRKCWCDDLINVGMLSVYLRSFCWAKKMKKETKRTTFILASFTFFHQRRRNI